MSLRMPVVWTDRHRLHEPAGEVWVGVRTPGTELPQRAERIRTALTAAGASLVEPVTHPDAPASVHDPALLEHLATAWSEWEAAGLDREPGQDRVVPYLFEHPGLFSGFEPARAAAISARAGQFAYDTMTLIGPGTWDAARAAVDCAVTAAELALGGEGAAYACCRPPGHHAAGRCFGGSCYLNNAAAAAQRLAGGIEGPVAVLDVDAHHGNGTQEIFYSRDDVLTGSVHVDPAAGWFPHFLGFESERGDGRGEGANRNLCLAPGSSDEAWLAAIEELTAWAADRGAAGLVVALGVDAAGGDPESPLAVSHDGFRAAGRTLGALGLPTAIVQEGGYDLDQVGALVGEALLGFEQARA